MTAFEGYVSKLVRKDGAKSNGQKWFKHSVILTDGQTESEWLGTEFNAQFPVTEGQYLRLDAEKDAKGYWVIAKGSAKVVSDPPARKGAQTASGAPASTGSTEGPSSQKQATIGYQNARTAAIAIVSLALENKALPVTKTDSKAGEATRYTQILDFIDKLTVRLYNDADTLRLLDSVADEGSIPETSETPTVAETTSEEADDVDPDDDVSF